MAPRCSYLARIFCVLLVLTNAQLSKRFPDALTSKMSDALSRHSKALSDLNAKDTHALQRLMSRPELRSKLAPHLNMFNKLTGGLSPTTSDTKEVSFTLNAPTPIF